MDRMVTELVDYKKRTKT